MFANDYRDEFNNCGNARYEIGFWILVLHKHLIMLLRHYTYIDVAFYFL
jgi:hypothetical protein